MAGDAFLGLLEYFAPLLTTKVSFHHRSALIGRGEELAHLEEALGESDNSVVLVTGAGGQGKSRLLLEALRDMRTRHPERPVLVRTGSGPLDSVAASELPDHPAVVLVEDAHRDPEGVVAALHHARRIPGTKIVLSALPFAAPGLRASVVGEHFESNDMIQLRLEPLDRDKSEVLVAQLAQDAELSLTEEFANALAGEARDCPTLAVIATSMIAQGTLTSAALPLNHGFREAILDRFSDVMRTGIPGVNATEASAVLAVVAALAPTQTPSRTEASVENAPPGLRNVDHCRVHPKRRSRSPSRHQTAEDQLASHWVVVDGFDEAASAQNRDQIIDLLNALSYRPEVRAAVGTRAPSPASPFEPRSVLRRFGIHDATATNLLNLDLAAFAAALLHKDGNHHPGPAGRAWQQYRADPPLNARWARPAALKRSVRETIAEPL